MSALHWEHALLSRANEVGRLDANPLLPPVVDKSLLNRAYTHCDSLTAVHSRSFYLASRLLPVRKRRAVRVLYAFCRVCDNIVDESGGNAERLLAEWRECTLSSSPWQRDPVAIAWMDVRSRYRIPRCYAEQFIAGIARDLEQTRYETFADLTTYAYGVASTVGLMCMHIVGFSGLEAIPCAIKMGVALQVTDILRDVGEDWRMGRLYLPAAELAQFGLTEADLAAGRIGDRWRAFMRFQIARNRRLYAEAWPGISMLPQDGRLAIATAAELYRAILDDIEAHDYDVFTRRAQVSDWAKLRKLPGIWRRGRTGAQHPTTARRLPSVVDGRQG